MAHDQNVPNETPGEAESRRAAQDTVIQSVLAAGGSYADAALEARVSARTVRRRMTDDLFVREVAVLRAERVGQVTSQLVELSNQAVEVLGEALGHEEPHVRLKAAGMVLTHMSRLRADQDRDLRLAVIEETLAAAEGGTP